MKIVSNGESVDILEAPSNYSTKEVIIGKWIDGRPVYMTTFIKTNYTQSADVIIGDTSNLNIEYLVSVTGGFSAKKGFVSLNTSYSGTTYYNISFLIGESRSAIIRGDASKLGTGTSVVTIKYTKEIDEA